MKDMLKITLSLVAIFVVAGMIMGVTYKYTYAGPVCQAEKKEKEEALKEMAPDATDPIKPAGNWTADNKPYEYYRGDLWRETGSLYRKHGGQRIFKLTSRCSFRSGPDLKIRDVKILGHEETPGLGDQVEDKSFLDQFKGKSLSQIVLVKGRDEGEHPGRVRRHLFEPRRDERR